MRKHLISGRLGQDRHKRHILNFVPICAVFAEQGMNRSRLEIHVHIRGDALLIFTSSSAAFIRHRYS